MHSYRAECMGTGFIFQIEDQAEPEKLDALCDSALEVLEDANQRFSLYMDNSEISRLNRGELDWSQASYQQQQIREKAEAWRERTAGYFDARVGGSEYDPSGIVKAWATQNAADFLLANGVRGFTINAGGDIYLSPELESPGLNRVGLSNLKSVASEGSGANLVLDLSSSSFRAVATSGISERGEHIWRKDKAAEFIQVSVVGEDLVSSDIWATAIISGGRAAWKKFCEKAEGQMVAIATTKQGELISSPGFVKVLASL